MFATLVAHSAGINPAFVEGSDWENDVTRNIADPLESMPARIWSQVYLPLPHPQPAFLPRYPNSFPVPIFKPGWTKALWEQSVLPKSTTQWHRQGSNSDRSMQSPAP